MSGCQGAPPDCLLQGPLYQRLPGPPTTLKWQGCWAVLRSASAYGGKRIDLYHSVTAFNEATPPFSSLPLSEVLAVKADIAELGKFPFLVLRTGGRHRLVCGCEEERKQWMQQLHLLLHGPPAPVRAYEFRVEVVGTGLAEQLSLCGQQLLRVTATHLALHGIGRSGTKTRFICPLGQLERVQEGSLPVPVTPEAILPGPPEEHPATPTNPTPWLVLHTASARGKGLLVLMTESTHEIAKLVMHRKSQLARKGSGHDNSSFPSQGPAPSSWDHAPYGPVGVSETLRSHSLELARSTLPPANKPRSMSLVPLQATGGLPFRDSPVSREAPLGTDSPLTRYSSVPEDRRCHTHHTHPLEATPPSSLSLPVGAQLAGALWDETDSDDSDAEVATPKEDYKEKTDFAPRHRQPFSHQPPSMSPLKSPPTASLKSSPMTALKSPPMASLKSPAPKSPPTVPLLSTANGQLHANSSKHTTTPPDSGESRILPSAPQSRSQMRVPAEPPAGATERGDPDRGDPEANTVQSIPVERQQKFAEYQNSQALREAASLALGSWSPRVPPPKRPQPLPRGRRVRVSSDNYVEPQNGTSGYESATFEVYECVAGGGWRGGGAGGQGMRHSYSCEAILQEPYEDFYRFQRLQHVQRSWSPEGGPAGGLGVSGVPGSCSQAEASTYTLHNRKSRSSHDLHNISTQLARESSDTLQARGDLHSISTQLVRESSDMLQARGDLHSISTQLAKESRGTLQTRDPLQTRGPEGGEARGWGPEGGEARGRGLEEGEEETDYVDYPYRWEVGGANIFPHPSSRGPSPSLKPTTHDSSPQPLACSKTAPAASFPSPQPLSTGYSHLQRPSSPTDMWPHPPGPHPPTGYSRLQRPSPPTDTWPHPPGPHPPAGYSRLQRPSPPTGTWQHQPGPHPPTGYSRLQRPPGPGAEPAVAPPLHNSHSLPSGHWDEAEYSYVADYSYVDLQPPAWPPTHTP